MSIVKIIGGFFLDIIESVVVALSIFLIIYLFVMQPHQVNGSSMLPNFQDGEYLLTDKITYKRRLPERGDIVVFSAPPEAHCPEGTGCDFIKRILAVPGDTVEVREDKIVVNGILVLESYLPETYVTRPGAYTMSGPRTIPSNHYFVTGDNRNHSSDSRAWGPVPLENIVGRVFFRYWPPSKLGLIEHVNYSGL